MVTTDTPSPTPLDDQKDDQRETASAANDKGFFGLLAQSIFEVSDAHQSTTQVHSNVR